MCWLPQLYQEGLFAVCRWHTWLKESNFSDVSLYAGLFYLCICVCVAGLHAMFMQEGAYGEQRNPYSRRYRKWWATQCECWELNSGPLGKQSSLNPEPFPQLQRLFLSWGLLYGTDQCFVSFLLQEWSNSHSSNCSPATVCADSNCLKGHSSIGRKQHLKEKYQKSTRRSRWDPG